MVALAIFLAVFIAFVFAFLFFWGINPGEVTVFLTSDYSLTQPIPIMIIGAIMIGLIIGYTFHLVSLMTHGVQHWRLGRRDKKGKETVSLYREGVGRLLSGDLKKAHDQLQKALDRDPSRVETYIAMANVYQQEDRPEESVNLLRKARDIEPESLEVLFKLAAVNQEMGQDEEASRALREILSLESGNRKALRSLRDLHMKEGRWEEALEVQKRVLKVGPGPNRLEEEKQLALYLRYEVARQALEQERTDQAKSEFKEIIKKSPEFAPARVSLGDLYAAEGRSEEAAKVWQEGYRELTKTVFLSRLEDLYLEAEDPASLLSFYRSALVQNDKDLVLRLYFGRLCLRLEMVDEALEQLYAVESSGVEFPQLHLLLAEAHRRRQRTDEAIGEYQRALGVDSQLRFDYVCEKCGAETSEWCSRCATCGAWDSYSLADRQLIQEARPLEMREIHHGERS